MTVDEWEGHETTREEALSGRWLLVDQTNTAQLMAMFGYTYEEARSFSPSWAEWFIAFRGMELEEERSRTEREQPAQS